MNPGENENLREVYMMEEDWDNLIILDACRYDYFKKIYEDYLSGELKKVRSPAHHTEKWRKRVFPEKYEDTVYVSANPYLNSKAEIKGFSASEHFHKVIDVWAWGWDEELKTVHPREVNKAVKEARKDYPDKRLLIHYLQPHAPYLSLGSLPGGSSFQEVQRELDSKGNLKAFLERIRDELGKKIVKNISWELAWRFTDALNVPPSIPEEAAFRKVGTKGMREAYEENLKTVLKYTQEIIKELNGKIVITADHGELLGEDGQFVHHDENNPILREVPWLETTAG